PGPGPSPVADALRRRRPDQPGRGGRHPDDRPADGGPGPPVASGPGAPPARPGRARRLTRHPTHTPGGMMGACAPSPAAPSSLARRPVVRRLLVLAPAAALLAGCGGATADAPAPATSAVAPAADQADPDLGVDVFAERVAEEGTVVLDVRTPAEFAQGHLPGA